MTGRIAGAVAGLAGLVALVLVGTGAGPTILGGLGVLSLGLGLLGRRSTAITLGCACLFAALLWAGVAGGGSEVAGTRGTDQWAIVVGGAAVVFAWTVGRTSVALRRDLQGVDTRRLEATHVAGTTVLVGGAAAVAAIPGVVTVRPSPLGLALVVFGAVTLTTALWLE